MNALLVLIILAIGCTLLLALLEPNFMRWICAKGIGWALAFELFKKNLPEAIRRSEVDLGVEQYGPMLVRKERA